jgi:hypothetical protein
LRRVLRLKKREEDRDKSLLRFLLEFPVTAEGRVFGDSFVPRMAALGTMFRFTGELG